MSLIMVMKESANSSMTICHLIPRIGGAGCGVGDYAELLTSRLEAECGFRADILTVEIGPEAGKEGRYEMQVERRSGALAEALEGQSRILLHYVGYGFQKRGCPMWLLRGLKIWKQQHPGAVLITMFHELYASGMPWQSSFWMSPLQRWICRDLARMSDWIVTNRTGSADLLTDMTGREDVIHLPVFSNVGEPDVRVPVENRRPWLVLFGGREWRTTAWVRDRQEIEAACRRWGIQEVLEIGAGETPIVELGVPVRRLGKLPAGEVSDWLCRSRLGFISYPSTYLEKSGIFAAYAAHGVVPVLPQRSMMPQALGVIGNQHYVCPVGGEIAVSFLEERSRDVYAWYQGHHTSEHARTFAKLFSIHA